MMRIFTLALGCAVLTVGAPAMAQHPGGPAATATGAQAATADSRRADVSVLRERFLDVDKAYSTEARAEASARLDRLAAAGEHPTPAQFELEIARIVALADNGHTATFANPRSRSYNRAPVRLYPFGEDFHVLRATQANADLLGGRLVAIDGRPIEAVRAVARSLGGGIPAWRDRFAAYFLESPEQLHALEVAEDRDGAVYVFEMADGRRVERRLEGEAPTAPRSRANTMRTLSPAKPADEGEDWVGLVSESEATPWALRDPTNPFRMRNAPEIDGVVIDIRANTNVGERRIADALREFQTALEADRPTNLVLDMRLNGGGDLNTTRAFMQRLPSLVDGRIFVLVSPWTFSAAISSTGYLEQAAPDRVTIVGEPVGDRLMFFAEGDVITLPNSGIMVLGATERHDYVDGCRAYSDCHGSIVRNPIAVPTLEPDIAAPWTIQAYRSGRDPAMEAVVAALAPA